MVRNDGIYKIYMIQHQWDKGGEWIFSAYGQPEVKDEKKGFDACGDCWQETGEHGTYDLETAKEGLKQARKDVKKDFESKDERSLPKLLPLRIVLVSIMQQTVPI